MINRKPQPKYGDVAVQRLYINSVYSPKNPTMNKPLLKGKYQIESTSLPDKDYATNGWYFVTICTKNCIYYFGNDVVSGKVQLTPIGKIAQQYFIDIPKYFKHSYIYTHIVMPNHIHGIVVLNKPKDIVKTRYMASRNIPSYQSNKFSSLKADSLQAILHSYKSSVTWWCRKNGYQDFKWQERFYESIIRVDGSVDRIRQYIMNNPAKWEENKNNPPDLWM